jgi:heme/copper-type cytochrome/quinol oxidase subunit 4
MDIVKLIWPLALVQLILQIYAIIDILKRRKTKNLNPTIWILIVILGEILGTILYFSVGKSEEEI